MCIYTHKIYTHFMGIIKKKHVLSWSPPREVSRKTAEL